MADKPESTLVKAKSLGTYGKKMRKEGEIFRYSGPTTVERPLYDKMGQPQNNPDGSQKMKKEEYFPSWMEPVDEDELTDDGGTSGEGEGQGDKA